MAGKRFDKVPKKRLGTLKDDAKRAKREIKEFREAKMFLFGKFMTPEIHKAYPSEAKRVEHVSRIAHDIVYHLNTGTGGKKLVAEHGPSKKKILDALEKVSHPFNPELYNVAEREAEEERLVLIGQEFSKEGLSIGYTKKKKK